MENDNKTGVSLSSVSGLSVSSPVLSSDLLTLFGALDNGKRRIFRKLYTYLWRYLRPLDNYSILQDYWAFHYVITDVYKLPFGLVALLSWLYQVSGKGVNIIDSRRFNNTRPVAMSVRNIYEYMSVLRKSGYIERYTRDPSAPYLLRSVSRQPIFIKVTDAGCKLVEDIERETYNLIMRSVMREITTGKPKRKARKKA
jgi:hypothetical protein